MASSAWTTDQVPCIVECVAADVTEFASGDLVHGMTGGVGGVPPD
jgi:hypothetical protein